MCERERDLSEFEFLKDTYVFDASIVINRPSLIPKMTYRSNTRIEDGFVLDDEIFTFIHIGR